MTSEAEIRVLPRTFHLPKIESARDKVRTIDELSGIARHLRDSGRSVVQAHGAFGERAGHGVCRVAYATCPNSTQIPTRW